MFHTIIVSFAFDSVLSYMSICNISVGITQFYKE